MQRRKDLNTGLGEEEEQEDNWRKQINTGMEEEEEVEDRSGQELHFRKVGSSTIFFYFLKLKIKNLIALSITINS